MKIINNIKKRFAKKSERGIYIQDKELLDTQFQVGENFIYEFDVKSKELLIKPSKDGHNTVSKRKLKTMTKPVIDIRDRAVLKQFKGHDKLEIEICEDIIIVRGIAEKVVDFSSLSTNRGRVIGAVKSFFNNVIPFKSTKKVVWETYLSKSDLFSSNVVGLSSFAAFSSAFDDFCSTSNIKANTSETAISLEVASLFSGFGGLDLGFINKGFTVKFANDIMEGATQSYRFNIGDHVVHQDVLKLDLDSIPATPVMIFGSSCKPFSNANRSKTRLKDHIDYKLFNRTIEAIENNPNCKVFVWENVPRMVSSEGVVDEIVERLSDFEISYAVLNSASYGTAMTRERVFIVGSKIGKFEFPEAYRTADNYVTVGAVLKGLTPGLPNYEDRSNSSEFNIKRMAMIKPGGNWKDLPYAKIYYNRAKKKFSLEKYRNPAMGKSTHSNYLKKLDPSLPSISLANTRKSQVISPVTNLGLTVRECARVFGVADDYEFKGKLSERQEQITNSVPIRFSEAIANKVRFLIEQFNWRLMLKNRAFSK